ncbi:MAG: hypothetical protein AAF628_03535 [Planctomycetota bacterium]
MALAAVATLVAPRAQDDFRSAYVAAEQLRLDGAAAAAVSDAYARALDAFLAIAPGADEYNAWLPSGAFTAYCAGAFERAAALFEESMQRGNDDAFHAEHLLRALLAAGRAEPALRAAELLHPRHAAAVLRVVREPGALQQLDAMRQADAWLRDGDTERALWVFRLVAQATAEQPIAVGNLALALRHVGQVAESADLYRQALEAAPNDVILRNDYGLLRKGLGALAAARGILAQSRASETEPGRGPATTNLAVLALRGEGAIPEARAQVSAALALRPDAAFLRRCALELAAAAEDF